ncbi:hypothetical protein TNCT_536811 [Trichonephila clavata]|uniref:Uncharacterized protein n=1 Tax=Trichonephila clavata TaxID=2740835 RepID=A0A8X6F7Q8_TRICU|nr:hypothetical protein TNCT_536811 [Trichonephila clavata]
MSVGWKGSVDDELQALTNVSVTSHQHFPKKLTDEAKFMIFIIFIFLILAAIGTTITAYDCYYKPHRKCRCSNVGGIDIEKHIHPDKEKVSIEKSGGQKGSSKEVFFKKLKTFFNCFCVYTNGRRILSTVSNDGEFCGYMEFDSLQTFGLLEFMLAYSISAL